MSSYGLAKLKVERILKKLDPSYSWQDLDEPAAFPGLTDAEIAFVYSARTRHGAKLWRAGWPDFLVRHPKLGVIGVEVKGPGDRLSRRQIACFDALEMGGLRVFVWDSTAPTRLCPWRRFRRRARR